MDMDRVHFICKLLGDVPCADKAPNNCTQETCYIIELLEIGKAGANAPPSKE